MRLFVTKESAWRFSADQSVKIFYESPGLLFLRFVPPHHFVHRNDAFWLFLDSSFSKQASPAGAEKCRPICRGT